MAPSRIPVSIVCVFNDEKVRRQCLDASIDRLRSEAPDIDYVPIDNVEGQFRSAGEALNSGIARARHDYFVLVHQDVVLHSLAALEQAAGILASSSFAVLGASGVTADGRWIGRIRDRVILVGESAPTPVEVDSVDEVLFVISRSFHEREPITADPDLQWHGYAVEYGMRARSLGLKVGAADFPLTHNSLTTNLARLDQAHARLAALYPSQLPLRTTCGVVAESGRLRQTIPEMLKRQRSWYRWLRESTMAARIGRSATRRRTVLADIRLDIDHVIGELDALFVFNLDGPARFVDAPDLPLALDRDGRRVTVASGCLRALRERARCSDRVPVLFTNLELSDVQTLTDELSLREHLVGIHSHTQHWILVAPPLRVESGIWAERTSRPFRQ